MIFDKYIAKQKIDKVIFHLKKWEKEKYHSILKLPLISE